MRVLASSTSGSGHWRPLLPVLTALRDAGHEVCLCVPQSAADKIPLEGIEVQPFADADFPSPEQAELMARSQREGDPMLMEQAIGLGFSYWSPRAGLPALTAAFERHRPELVVADPAEGEARFRDELGLAGPATVATILVTRTPEAFEVGDRGRWGHLPTLRFRSRPAPAPPASGTAHVYATLGTAAMQTPMGLPTLRVLVDGLGQVDADATITVGTLPDVTVPLPSNVELAAFADHEQVIPASRVVVTHGGSGTVADANEHRRPMVVLPLFADQFHNATAVMSTGIGTCLIGQEQTPDALAARVRAALAGNHDESVNRMSSQIASLPTPAQLPTGLSDWLAGAP